MNWDVVRDPHELSVQEWMSASAPAITRGTGVGTALRLLRESELPALPLVENGTFVGLVFEKDLLRLAPSEATTLDVYELRDVLDKLKAGRALRSVEALAPNASLAAATLRMGHDHLEALPIADGDCFVGLLTWPAVLRALGRMLLVPTQRSVAQFDANAT